MCHQHDVKQNFSVQGLHPGVSEQFASPSHIAPEIQLKKELQRSASTFQESSVLCHDSSLTPVDPWSLSS